MYSSLTKSDGINPLPLGRNGAQIVADDDTEAVLRFLAKKPAHCAYMRGLIRDNGLISDLNRGTFYASKNILGQVRGLALVGHATIIEPTNQESLRELAEATNLCDSIHLIICEERWADQFWNHYTTIDRTEALERGELLMELRWPTVHSNKNRLPLRLATTKDIKLLLPLHARLACAESGVDPRDVDHAGFAERYHQRIRHGRTWVVVENDQLIFKAEVVAATDETCYLEGIWVSPDARGLRYGRASIAELARMLLWRSRSLSLLVNYDNKEAQSFYKSCGFQVCGSYRTAFLSRGVNR